MLVCRADEALPFFQVTLEVFTAARRTRSCSRLRHAQLTSSCRLLGSFRKFDLTSLEVVSQQPAELECSFDVLAAAVRRETIETILRAGCFC